ncbi:hypothetical protein GLA29479_408 [Lysobacter antibioticus]|nr:hypothetical protein GLA29479_408 [Lysobacter antibioticus]
MKPDSDYDVSESDSNGRYIQQHLSVSRLDKGLGSRLALLTTALLPVSRRLERG